MTWAWPRREIEGDSLIVDRVSERRSVRLPLQDPRRLPSRRLKYHLPMPVRKNATLTIAADGVGAVSAALGGLLTIAPLTGGRWLGLAGTDVKRRRVLGAADLALGITIIVGRSSRWRWRVVGVRALLHLLFAREYTRNSRRHNAVAMCALFIVDAGIAIGLRGARLSV